jgi:DNA-binding CsgD family transcriptional regulator
VAAGSVQGPLAKVRVAHAGALRDGDGDGLADAARRFAALGVHLFAAEAMTQAAGAHRRAGTATVAERAETEAAVLRRRCPDARTPGLARTPAVFDLSRREREMAGLAAAGRSSKQIAAELGVAVRTVDNTLARVYRKLDVAGRADLAEVLGLR